MPVLYYSEALKQGMKQKRAAAAAGLPGTLAALDELLAGRETRGEADAGLMQIPMELIGGAVSASREMEPPVRGASGRGHPRAGESL